MHHIYHTEAFVLGSRPQGEDSKTLMLYTRELGLVYVRAQAVRKISSKLRFILQDFSEANVDLVRGKELWRLTTATPIASHAALRRDADTERILARIASLVIRMVSGEETNDEVYAAIGAAYAMLGAKKRTREEYRALELISVSRILTALGYISRETLFPEFQEENDIARIASDTGLQHKMIRDINQALAASQL